MESLIFPLLIALLAVPLFLQARKQKKTMQEQQRLQNSLAVGDEVMTTSGLVGTIVGTDEDRIELEVAPGVNTTWVRAAIRERVNAEPVEDSVADDDSDESDLDDSREQDNTAVQDDDDVQDNKDETAEGTKAGNAVEGSKTS